MAEKNCPITQRRKCDSRASGTTETDTVDGEPFLLLLHRRIDGDIVNNLFVLNNFRRNMSKISTIFPCPSDNR